MTTPIKVNFGIPKTTAPEIFIEFNPFEPDINTGGNRINLTKVDGVELFAHGIDPDKTYNSLGYEWFNMGDLVSTLQNPKLSELKGTSNGLLLITCKVTFLPLGLKFERSKWCWFEYQDEELTFTTTEQRTEINPDYLTVPNHMLDVFEPWFPESFSPYDNARLDNDFDNNGIVGSSDLTTYLAQYLSE